MSRSHRLRYLSYSSIRFAAIAVHLRLWEEQQQVFASFPRGWASCLPPVWPAVHCVCIDGSRFSAVIGLCRTFVETSGRHCRVWTDSSASESACLHRGGHPTERAGSVVWAGTPDPLDLSSPRWSPPLQQSAASALPEGSHMPRAEEKTHRDFLSCG